MAKRYRHPMPDFVARALKANKLATAFHARPPFQRNEYLGWVMGGKRQATIEKRLAQMLDELRRGDTYMKMPWNPKS